MAKKQIIKDSAITGARIDNKNLVNNDSGLVSKAAARKVYRVMKADGVNVGTLPVLRAFAGNHLDYVSPYVLFDEFGPVNVNAGDDPLRVDAHPHAGVIPTTYFIAGNGHHKDSLNFDFQIAKGDFMMFSSGKGAIHMEESGKGLYDDGGIYHGFQIWLNMPAKHKFDEPYTKVFNEKNMDTIQNDDYSVKVLLGQLGEAKSEIELISPAFYYHIKMKENSKIEIPVEENHNTFIYLIDGEVDIEGNRKVEANHIVLYERQGNIVELYSECDSDLLMLGGKPLNEPVYSYGPFVMNTEEQINWCIQSYRSGKMGNPELVNR